MAESHKDVHYWPCQECAMVNLSSWSKLYSHKFFAHNKGEMGCLICHIAKAGEKPTVASTEVDWYFEGTLLKTPFEFLIHKISEHSVQPDGGEAVQFPCGYCGKASNHHAILSLKWPPSCHRSIRLF